MNIDCRYRQVCSRGHGGGAPECRPLSPPPQRDRGTADEGDVRGGGPLRDRQNVPAPGQLGPREL